MTCRTGHDFDQRTPTGQSRARKCCAKFPLPEFAASGRPVLSRRRVHGMAMGQSVRAADQQEPGRTSRPAATRILRTGGAAMTLTNEQIAAVERALACSGLWPLHGVLRFLFGPDLRCAARRPGSPMTAGSGLSTAQVPAAADPLPVVAGASLGSDRSLASSRSEPGVPIRYRRRPMASLLPGLAVTTLFPPDDQGGNAELRRQTAQHPSTKEIAS
jgi:hypothetical protein